MTNTNRILTLDIEGDGLDASRNQELFPEGNHQDPNTQIWCATIAYKDDNNKLITDTYIAKLPNHPRLVKPILWNEDHTIMLRDEIWTSAFHDVETKVPKKINIDNKWLNGCKYEQRIHELDSEWDLISWLVCNLLTYDYMGYNICCKGYGEYNYDYLAIYNSFNRLKANREEDEDSILDIEYLGKRMINAAKEFPAINKLWQETSKQVKCEQRAPNQEYIRWGVKHNMEDSIQLLNLLQKPIAEKNKLDSINEDF